jgi:2-oxoglutarate dehydrogenase E1 component
MFFSQLSRVTAAKKSSSAMMKLLSGQTVLAHSRMAAFNQSNVLHKPSASYHDQMYHQWSQNPASVDSSWQKHFDGSSGVDVDAIVRAISSKGASEASIKEAHAVGTKVMSYIRAHMTNGHFVADLDPLQLQETYAEIGSQFNTTKAVHKDILDIANYGFAQEDLDKLFYIDLPQWGGLLAEKKEWTLRELRDKLHAAYCGKIGVEYMHIPDREQCNYIRKKIEMRQYDDMTTREREIILDRILMTDEFSNFISAKFNTMKRFGLEGCESLIPGLKAMMTTLKNGGAEKVVIGMPHRGRLSLLANVINKPLEVIFAEFQGQVPL